MLPSCAVRRIRLAFPSDSYVDLNCKVVCLFRVVYCELKRVRCSSIASALAGRWYVLHSDRGISDRDC